MKSRIRKYVTEPATPGGRCTDSKERRTSSCRLMTVRSPCSTSHCASDRVGVSPRQSTPGVTTQKLRIGEPRSCWQAPGSVRREKYTQPESSNASAHTSTRPVLSRQPFTTAHLQRSLHLEFRPPAPWRP